MPFKDDNIILLCRQINNCIPTQIMQIVDMDLLANIYMHKVNCNYIKRQKKGDCQ